MKDPKSMRRRAFLGACGGAGAGLLSGCTDTSSNPSGPETNEETPDQDIEAEIKTDGKAVELLDVRVDADSITYTDEFTITAVLGNVGEEPIHDADPIATVRVGIEFTETDRSFQQDERSDYTGLELDPGETTVETFGPFNASVAGEWTVRAAYNIEYVAPEAKTTFEVVPKEVGIGESIPVHSGLSMTFEGFHLRKTFFSQSDMLGREPGETLVKLLTAPDGQCFAIPEVTVENDASRPINVQEYQGPYQLGRAQFSITPRAQDREKYERSNDSPWMSGPPLQEQTVSEGETAPAWLRAPVEIADRKDVALEFNKIDETGPPEAIFEIPDPRYPEFKVTDFEAPDQFVEGPQTFKMTVENIGNVAGDFHGVIQYNEGGDDYLRNPPVGYELTKTVDPGEEAIVTVEYDHELGTRYESVPFSGIAEV